MRHSLPHVCLALGASLLTACGNSGRQPTPKTPVPKSPPRPAVVSKPKLERPTGEVELEVTRLRPLGELEALFAEIGVPADDFLLGRIPDIGKLKRRLDNTSPVHLFVVKPEKGEKSLGFGLALPLKDWQKFRDKPVLLSRPLKKKGGIVRYRQFAEQTGDEDSTKPIECELRPRPEGKALLVCVDSGEHLDRWGNWLTQNHPAPNPQEPMRVRLRSPGKPEALKELVDEASSDLGPLGIPLRPYGSRLSQPEMSLFSQVTGKGERWVYELVGNEQGKLDLGDLKTPIWSHPLPASTGFAMHWTPGVSQELSTFAKPLAKAMGLPESGPVAHFLDPVAWGGSAGPYVVFGRRIAAPVTSAAEMTRGKRQRRPKAKLPGRVPGWLGFLGKATQAATDGEYEQLKKR